MEKVENGRILIVESDKFMRILLEKLCSSTYEVVTVENGQKALQLLEVTQENEKPWVIISNQVMPGMKGTDFLRQSQEFAPESVKILLTAEEQTKEIVMAMQKANAYLFQPKPFKNLPLLQSIKVSIDKYKSRKTIAKLNHAINNLKQQNVQYFKAVSDYKARLSDEKKNNTSGSKIGVDLGFYKYLSFIASNSERWYFTPHTKEVVSLVGHLARQMELSKNDINSVTLAAMIHNNYMVIMPPRLQILQPFLDNSKEELKEYIAYYYSAFEQLTSIDGIGDIGRLACMIWEKYDGTGFPQAIGGMNFPITGQILAIANLYHDLVYKLRRRDVERLKTKGKIEQPYEETMSRHNEAIAFMFKHVKWFDQDLLNLFKNSAKRGTFKHFQPRKETLVIDFNKADFLVVEAGLTSKEKYDREQSDLKKKKVTILDDEGNEKAKTIESVKLDQLQPDMELNEDIETETGNVVTKKGTKLNQEQIEKILKMKDEGVLGKTTSIIYDDLDELEEENPWGSKDMLIE